MSPLTVYRSWPLWTIRMVSMALIVHLAVFNDLTEMAAEEMIPKPGVGARISGYPLEVVKVKENRVKLVRVYPKLRV